MASIAGNGIIYIPPPLTPRDWGITLVYGTAEGPADLDPMDAWDEYSFAVQDQVCEGLFGYNYSDPDMEIIPKLAKEFGIWEGANYTVVLRDDVWFHDGTKFDATAAKWNFDRLYYLMNNGLAKAGELFEYYDVSSKSFQPIINHTEVIDDLTLKFVCNTPYGPFEALLCFNAAYMLSPTSTSLMKIFDTAIGHLIGTGPFVYDHYEAGVEIRFHAWDYYYKPRAKIDTLFFSVINDAQLRNNALLTGDVDILLTPLSSLIDILDSNPKIELKKSSQSVSITYLAMNNYWINSSFRKAISYAFNYSFVIEELLDSQALRLKSPIPQGIFSANDSYNVSITNISKARELMQSMGFGVGWNITYPGSDDGLWKTASFAVFNYSYSIGNYLQENIYSVLVNNMQLIGIEIINGSSLFFCPFCNYYCLIPPELCLDNMQLFFYGRIPDFNDPSNYINSLFNNRTVSLNGCRYNGYLAAIQAGRNPFDIWDNVQLLMEEALIEVNKTTRKQYYNRIQELLVEQDNPMVYSHVSNNIDAWNKDLKGFPSNPMDKVYFYPCYWDNTAFYAQYDKFLTNRKGDKNWN